MSCDRYRPLMGLLVGNDLGSLESAEVRQHLNLCPACQTHWESLQESTAALHAVSQMPAAPLTGSLWNNLSRRVGRRPVGPREHAPGWLTLGAFSAACAALLWLTVTTPVFDFDVRDVQLADLPVAPIQTANPNSNQYPSLQLVDRSRALVPIQIGTEGDEETAPQQIPVGLGGPRSF